MPNAFYGAKDAWGRGVSVGSDRLVSNMVMTQTRTIGRVAVRPNIPQKACLNG